MIRENLGRRALPDGRVAGEGCHFIDLLRVLAGAPITGHAVFAMAAPTTDTVTLQLAFAAAREEGLKVPALKVRPALKSLLSSHPEAPVEEEEAEPSLRE